MRNASSSDYQCGILGCREVAYLKTKIIPLFDQIRHRLAQFSFSTDFHGIEDLIETVNMLLRPLKMFFKLSPQFRRVGRLRHPSQRSDDLVLRTQQVL